MRPNRESESEPRLASADLLLNGCSSIVRGGRFRSTLLLIICQLKAEETKKRLLKLQHK
jgi:hypothetical protein